MKLERLRPHDWQRLKNVKQRALHDEPDAFGETAAEAAAGPPTEWRRRLERADAVTFVARLGNDDVGLAVGVTHYADERDAALSSVWVDPGARGQGVGEALITAVIAWAREAGYRRLRLDVGDYNTHAQALYKRMGLLPTGATGALPWPRQHITEHELALDL